MPVWYVLLAASFLAWRAAPRPRLFVACLVVYAVANWLILAAVEGNLGNLLRHRLTLDACLLILGGAGVYWLWLRLRGLRPLAAGRQAVLSAGASGPGNAPARTPGLLRRR